MPGLRSSGPFLLAALVAGTAWARPSSLTLTPCRLPDVPEQVKCGTLEVPENPARPDGRRLSIGLAVIPATGGRALPDPILVLLGGPGEDAIGAAASTVRQLESLRRDRDILLIDQRGTGRSAALPCALFSPEAPAISVRDLFPVEAVRRCEKQLSARADLTQYGFLRFIDDLEHVRRALGYGPVNLFAGSYGTRAAQVYIRAYPGSVRTAYLGSVIPVDVTIPLPFAKTAQEALERLLDACTQDQSCHEAFPDLRRELGEIMHQLDAQVRVRMTGQASAVELSRGRVVEWMRSKLYRPSSAAILPWAIHRAHAGDWTPIVDGILESARAADAALSFGLLLTITCSEDIPFLREADIVAETQGTLLGDYRIRQQQAACRRWPRYPLPREYRSPVRSSVPTFFVSGDADGGTPVWFMRHAAEGFSHHAELVVHGLGHTEWSDCTARLYERFVRTGSVRGLEHASCETVPWPPFKTG